MNTTSDALHEVNNNLYGAVSREDLILKKPCYGIKQNLLEDFIDFIPAKVSIDFLFENFDLDFLEKLLALDGTYVEGYHVQQYEGLYEYWKVILKNRKSKPFYERDDAIRWAIENMMEGRSAGFILHDLSELMTKEDL